MGYGRPPSRSPDPVFLPLAVAVLLLLPSGASAQPGEAGTSAARPGEPRAETRPRLSVSPGLRLQSISLLGRIEGTLRDGGVLLGAGPRRVGADVRAQAGLYAGLSTGLRIGRSFHLRAEAGRGESTFEVAARSTASDGSDPRFLELEELGRITVWSGTLGGVWRFGGDRDRVGPYAGGGVGLSRWSLTGLESLPSIEAVVGDSVGIRDVSSVVLPAAEVVAGVAVALLRRLRLRLELSDHVSRNPLDDRDFALGSSLEAEGRSEDWVHQLRGGASLEIGLLP